MPAREPWPCERVPLLFETVRHDGARATMMEKRSAVWLCERRCPNLAACALQEPVPLTVHAGKVIDHRGTAHVLPRREPRKTTDSPRRKFCACGAIVPRPRKQHCSPQCSERAQWRSRVPAPDELAEEIRQALAGELTWPSLTILARRAAVTELHARGMEDAPIAEALGGTRRGVYHVRGAVLKLPANGGNHGIARVAR